MSKDKDKDKDKDEDKDTGKVSKWEAMTSNTNPALDSFWAEQFSHPDYHGH